MDIINLHSFALEVIKILFFAFFLTAFSINIFLQKKAKKFLQPIRAEGPQSHIHSKKNTPTLGGIFFVCGTILTATLFTKNIFDPYFLLLTVFVLAFSAIGLTDDLMKIFCGNSKGFRGSYRISLQFTISAIAIICLYLINPLYLKPSLNITLFNNYQLYLGFLMPFFMMIFIVGIANATNLTDGLDGLLSIPAIITIFCIILLAILASDPALATKYRVDFLQNINAIIPFMIAMIGSIFAFLFFNFKPAKIFMGDVGSLAIGATIAIGSAILRQEFIMFFVCGLFIIEALSVILQVLSYKIRKRRIFLMAPIHHHFEKKGWSELKVVIIFWLFSLILALFTGLIFLNS